MTNMPVVYGTDDSVYVRIVRLALEEKGVAYTLVPVDVFAEGGAPADYIKRHPFGRIPAFEHDNFGLYETGDIVRYVDEALPGPVLQPADPKVRARMNQIISIADSYIYRPLVWDVFVERINKPQRGEVPDEARIAAALATAQVNLNAITALMIDGPWLLGSELTLADLHLAPMLDYFLITSEGRASVARYPALTAWWARMASRPSMLATAFPA
jgi:glutathione S-transferase